MTSLRWAHAASPSRRHELLACAVPRLRRSRELDTVETERARLVAWHATLVGGLPTRLVPRFARRFSVVTEVLRGPAGEFASYVVTPRGTDPRRTLLYLHGGGYVAGIDPFHVRHVASLATALGVRVVLPDYPLAPEHTWRDSHDAIADLATRWAADSDELLLAGDSAGGGYALALALNLRDRGGPQPRAGWCCTRPGSTSRPARPRPRSSPRATRGCSSASCGRTPTGGPGRPTTSAVPRCHRLSPT